MEPAEQAISFVQGDQYELVIAFRDLVLTGEEEFAAQIRRTPRSETVQAFAVEVDPAYELEGVGTVAALLLRLEPEQTVAIPEDAVYDVEWRHVDGPITFIRGPVTVIREVTRDDA